MSPELGNIASKKVAGVVLAGGQSSRMGSSKALLDYNGRPLLDHMIGLLQCAGINDIYVSGDLEGYNCIHDRVPHKGPAWAIYDVFEQLEDFDGIVFVPVDMPLLKERALSLLLKESLGAYFKDYPLPAYIVSRRIKERVRSVKELLIAANAAALLLPPELEAGMVNTNTPEEWAEVIFA